jgi:hypothetical protein
MENKDTKTNIFIFDKKEKEEKTMTKDEIIKFIKEKKDKILSFEFDEIGVSKDEASYMYNVIIENNYNDYEINCKDIKRLENMYLKDHYQRIKYILDIETFSNCEKNIIPLNVPIIPRIIHYFKFKDHNVIFFDKIMKRHWVGNIIKGMICLWQEDIKGANMYIKRYNQSSDYIIGGNIIDNYLKYIN